MRRALVLVPTYNEKDSIPRLLKRLEAARKDLLESRIIADLDLLVIDDNSPDGTADLVDSVSLPWVSVLRRPGKGGLGPAYIAGFKYGLARSYEYFVEMDADLSHQPEELQALLTPVVEGGADVTIGTRWMPGGKVVNWPLTRQLISRIGTRYAKFALKLPLRDLTSGYRVFRRQVLASIPLDKVEAQGYGFQIEMALRTFEKGYRVKEVAITFIEREGGVSKMSKKIVVEALWKVTLWGARRMAFRR